MFRKLLIIFVGIFALVGALFLSYPYIEKFLPSTQITKPVAQTPTKVVAKIPAKPTGTLVPKTITAEKTVVAPGPLRAVTSTPTKSDLTIQGIIAYTNAARVNNSPINGLMLSKLSENYLLDRDAQMKLDDMFAKQYFEHVSPTGVGPADLAQAVGYAYVVVGENLALGDFGSDDGVVTAWMNSPGHRANILKPQYQEIGVAVGKGLYEGRPTWIAVQSFGMPLSACPVTNPTLKAEIDVNNTTIISMRAALDAKKAQIDSTSPNDHDYNTYVNEFNAMVPEYNVLVDANRTNVATYNASVQAFNACIAGISVH